MDQVEVLNVTLQAPLRVETGSKHTYAFFGVTFSSCHADKYDRKAINT